MLPPVLDEIAQGHAEKMEVAKVNVDENPAVAARYGITSIPAAHVFQGGEVVATSVRAKPKQVPEEEFDQFLTSDDRPRLPEPPPKAPEKEGPV